MTSNTLKKPRQNARSGAGLIVGVLATAILIAAMGFSTKIVRIGSPDDVQAGVFTPEAYGASEFPKVKAAIEEKAVDASTLLQALTTNRADAEKTYGVSTSTGPMLSVKLTGTFGAVKSGIYDVAIAGFPEKLRVRVQTGPAINGTDLRDATGTIAFGQFTNQIEYQDAGSALNNQLKKDVLAKLDTTQLTGKTVSVTGAFKLINPNNWLITPVRLDVQ